MEFNVSSKSLDLPPIMARTDSEEELIYTRHLSLADQGLRLSHTSLLDFSSPPSELEEDGDIVNNNDSDDIDTLKKYNSSSDNLPKIVEESVHSTIITIIKPSNTTINIASPTGNYLLILLILLLIFYLPYYCYLLFFKLFILLRFFFIYL